MEDAVLHKVRSDKGDRCTQMFFKALNAHSQANRIRAVLEEDGTAFTSSRHILAWAIAYYERTLNKDDTKIGLEYVHAAYADDIRFVLQAILPNLVYTKVLL